MSKIFKSPKGLKCQRSSDAACYTNGTAMVVTCTNTAGGVATQMTVSAKTAAVVVMLQCVLVHRSWFSTD